MSLLHDIIEGAQVAFSASLTESDCGRDLPDDETCYTMCFTPCASCGVLVAFDALLNAINRDDEHRAQVIKRARERERRA